MKKDKGKTPICDPLDAPYRPGAKARAEKAFKMLEFIKRQYESREYSMRFGDDVRWLGAVGGYYF